MCFSKPVHCRHVPRYRQRRLNITVADGLRLGTPMYVEPYKRLHHARANGLAEKCDKRKSAAYDVPQIELVAPYGYLFFELFSTERRGRMRSLLLNPRRPRIGCRHYDGHENLAKILYFFFFHSDAFTNICFPCFRRVAAARYFIISVSARRLVGTCQRVNAKFGIADKKYIAHCCYLLKMCTISSGRIIIITYLFASKLNTSYRNRLHYIFLLRCPHVNVD